MSKVIERWRKVPGYNYYEVSNLGRVRSIDRMVAHRFPGSQRVSRGKVVKQAVSNSGYLQVHLWEDGFRRAFQVHRLVLAAFRGLDLNDEDQLGLHKDDDPMNNRLRNLRIGTTEDNIADKVAKGRAGGNTKSDRRGTLNPIATLTDAQVRRIFKLGIKRTMFQKDIAAKFNTTQATVSLIVCGKQWTHVTQGLS